MQAQVRLRSGAQGDGCEKGAQAVVDISDLATSRNLVELLLRRADAAMYAAKKAGRNQVVAADAKAAGAPA